MTAAQGFQSVVYPYRTLQSRGFSVLPRIQLGDGLPFYANADCRRTQVATGGHRSTFRGNCFVTVRRSCW